MRWQLGCVLICLSSLIATTEASVADMLTGADFLKLCVTTDPNSQPKDRDENDQIIRCLGYFEGTVTTMLALNGAGYCLPKDTRPTDILMTTINWLEVHPDQKKYLAASDIVAASQDKWPCKR